MKRAAPVTSNVAADAVLEHPCDLDALDPIEGDKQSPAITWDAFDRLPWPGSLGGSAVDQPVDLDNPSPVPASRTLRNPRNLSDHRRHAGTGKRAGRVHPAQSTSGASTGRWRVCVAGGLAFVTSFIVVMQLTKPPEPANAAIISLARSSVSDFSTLMAAVKAAGLRGSPDMTGRIDEMRRRSADDVALRGWAAQLGGNGSPITVMVFVEGRNQLTMETKGRRPDVTDALAPSGNAVANVAFEGDLACSRGEKVIVVAVAQSGLYTHFGSHLCP
jgi:hypothetical protein